MNPWSWRVLFAVSAVLLIAGGSNHPRGEMAMMLADPDWVWSHSLLVLSFLTLWIGLVLFRRNAALPSSTDRWVRWAIIGTGLQTLEMVFHAAAAVDAAAYAAGETGYVFMIHMTFTVLFNPLFAVLMIGLLWTGARERTLGSPWINWIGMLGAAAHGLAPILVVILGMQQFAILFPLVMLLALWLMAAAVWRVRAEERGRAEEESAGQPERQPAV